MPNKHHTLRDLTGKLIGKLKVIEQCTDPELCVTGRAYWWCECQVCEEEVYYEYRSLVIYTKHTEKGCYLCREKRK